MATEYGNPNPKPDAQFTQLAEPFDPILGDVYQQGIAGLSTHTSERSLPER